MARTRTICVCVIAGLCFGAIAQNTDLSANADVQAAAKSLDEFALNFLAETSDSIGDSLNLAIAPYTIWSLLSIISEGADGETERQLTSTLGIGNKQSFRKAYRDIVQSITKPTDGVRVNIGNAIFTPSDQILKKEFANNARNFYGVELREEDFRDADKALANINNYMSKATNGRIKDFLRKDDVQDNQVIMASTFYFKGEWSKPFNKTATKSEPFYDERNNAIGNVQMMYQAGAFPYSVVPDIGAHAVELPYGNGDKMSMVIVVPRKGTPLAKVLKTLVQVKIDHLLDLLATAEKEFLDEDVQVYIPKFKVTSDLILNQVLDKLGIKDLFNQQNSNLLKMFHQYLYVSRIVHQAQIEINEEGTEASASASASLSYKSPPPVLIANRPFAYFILSKQTRSIIFAGKVSTPKGLY